ncbi:hypothetical protein ACXR2U_06825 [Jatrophihabitans sp. YIM 134969]
MADLRDDETGSPDVRSGVVPGTLLAAVVVVLLEALALVAVAVVVVAETVFGTPEDLAGSLLQAALAVVGAVVLVACARSLGRLRTSARTPVLVLQLLALPVAYSLWFQGSGRPQIGAPIAVAALVTIFLLFAPPSREALDRPE